MTLRQLELFLSLVKTPHLSRVAKDNGVTQSAVSMAIKALEEKVELSGKTCTIVGAGGAARAIGFILKENNVEVITWELPRNHLEVLSDQYLDALIHCISSGT